MSICLKTSKNLNNNMFLGKKFKNVYKQKKTLFDKNSIIRRRWMKKLTSDCLGNQSCTNVKCNGNRYKIKFKAMWLLVVMVYCGSVIWNEMYAQPVTDTYITFIYGIFNKEIKTGTSFYWNHMINGQCIGKKSERNRWNKRMKMMLRHVHVSSLTSSTHSKK